MYTSINIDIQTIYMHIHTQKYSICMYVYVYIGFSFLLSSKARLGNQRTWEEGHSWNLIAKRYSKWFKTPCSFSGLDSRTPVFTVKGDDLCHCASMAVIITSILTYTILLKIYTCIYAYTCIYVHIHYYMYMYMHIGLYMHIHTYKDIY